MSLLQTGGRVPQVFPSFLLKRLLEVLKQNPTTQLAGPPGFFVEGREET